MLDSTIVLDPKAKTRPKESSSSVLEQFVHVNGVLKLGNFSSGDLSPFGEPALLANNGLLALNGVLTGESVLSRPIAASASRPSEFNHPAMGSAKRVFDILFSACILLLILPLLAICALAVRLESRGPVFFRQRRFGHGGNTFSIVKFRTMVPDAESALKKHLENNPEARKEWAADHKLRNDPRVTRIGRFMRRFSVDELPQFWNVLIGDMSVVGPRPIVSAEIPYYGDDYRAYCQVRPGITGLWQVSGRNDTSYAYRVALDSRYVNDWSLKLDANIIARTVNTVVSASGAY